jgi:hypothetical protein
MRVRNVPSGIMALCAIVGLLAFSPQALGAIQSVKLEGMAYQKARKIILSYGWRPLSGSPCRTDGDVCVRFPEIAVCSDVAPGYCAMAFTNQKRCLYVTTTGGHLTEMFGMVPNPHIRVKEAPGVPYSPFILAVDSSTALDHPDTVVRSCSMMGSKESWEETLEAAQAYFGVPPSRTNSRFAQWVYVERDGQRRYLSEENMADFTGSMPLHSFSVARDDAQSGPPEIMYMEAAKAESSRPIDAKRP